MISNISPEDRSCSPVPVKVRAMKTITTKEAAAIVRHKSFILFFQAIMKLLDFLDSTKVKQWTKSWKATVTDKPQLTSIDLAVGSCQTSKNSHCTMETPSSSEIRKESLGKLLNDLADEVIVSECLREVARVGGEPKSTLQW